MFRFKQFTINDGLSAMKVGTDGVLLGAWAHGGSRILDIGTGSGIIAIMMAQRFLDAHVTAIDIDYSACIQARQNSGNSPFSDRIDIQCTPLQAFAASPEAAHTFDSIVCNPPFFTNSLKSGNASRDLARHTDTLSFRDLIHCSKLLLADGGTLSLVAPIDVKDDIDSEAIICGLSPTASVFVKTTANKQPRRFLSQYLNGYASPTPPVTKCLTAPGGSRSEWYQALTSPFYIK